MQEQLAEKFAHLLAECAATGNTAELQKEAAAHELVKEAVSPYLVGPAAGAMLGGLAGYYGTDSSKEKRRRRNALYGALSGGLGGLGGALLLNSPTGQQIKNFFNPASPAPAEAPKTDGSGSGGAPPSQTGGGDSQQTLKAPTLGFKDPTTYASAAGGAVAGAKGVGALQNKVVGPRGELNRLMGARPAPAVAKGLPAKNVYEKPLSALFEYADRNKDVAELLRPVGAAPAAVAHPGKWTRPELPKDPSLLPGFVSGHPESIKAMKEFEAAKTNYPKILADAAAAYKARVAAWNEYVRGVNAHEKAQGEFTRKTQDAKAILDTRSLGLHDAERARKADLVEELLTGLDANAKKRGVQPIGRATGTLLTDLAPYRTPRGGKRLGGIAGGILGWLANLERLNALRANQNKTETPTPAK